MTVCSTFARMVRFGIALAMLIALAVPMTTSTAMAAECSPGTAVVSLHQDHAAHDLLGADVADMETTGHHSGECCQAVCSTGVLTASDRSHEPIVVAQVYERLSERAKRAGSVRLERPPNA